VFDITLISSLFSPFFLSAHHISQCTIASLNLNHPSHDLTVRKVNLSKISPDSYRPMKGAKSNCILKPASNGSSRANTNVMEISSSDEDDSADFLHDESIFIDKQPTRRPQSLSELIRWWSFEYNFANVSLRFKVFLNHKAFALQLT